MLLQKLWLIKWGFGGEGEEQLWRQNPLSITNPSAKARIYPLPKQGFTLCLSLRGKRSRGKKEQSFPDKFLAGAGVAAASHRPECRIPGSFSLVFSGL